MRVRLWVLLCGGLLVSVSFVAHTLLRDPCRLPTSTTQTALLSAPTNVPPNAPLIADHVSIHLGALRVASAAWAPDPACTHLVLRGRQWFACEALGLVVIHNFKAAGSSFALLLNHVCQAQWISPPVRDRVWQLFRLYNKGLAPTPPPMVRQVGLSWVGRTGTVGVPLFGHTWVTANVTIPHVARTLDARAARGDLFVVSIFRHPLRKFMSGYNEVWKRDYFNTTGAREASPECFHLMGKNKTLRMAHFECVLSAAERYGHAAIERHMWPQLYTFLWPSVYAHANVTLLPIGHFNRFAAQLSRLVRGDAPSFVQDGVVVAQTFRKMRVFDLSVAQTCRVARLQRLDYAMAQHVGWGSAYPFPSHCAAM